METKKKDGERLSPWMIRMVLLGVLLMTAFRYDWKERRIPNLLCAFGLGLGIILLVADRSFFTERWWVGAVLPMMILFLLWYLRVIGGGDVKLLWMSSLYIREVTVEFYVLTAAYSAFFGTVKLWSRGILFQRLQIFGSYLSDCMKERRIGKYPALLGTEKEDGSIPLSYGAAAAYVTCVVMHFLAGS